MPRFAPHPARRPALVTGASSGIGAAAASALAGAGHPVVLAARRLDRLEELAAEIVADGGEAVAVPLDLTDDESIDRCAERAADVLGPLDIVISNAGEVVPRTVLDTDPDAFLDGIRVNMLGAHRLLQRLGPPMVERGQGDILFVSSDVVGRPRTHMAAYLTAKHGLDGMARAMQMELEGTGVRVSILRPGPSSTEQGTTWSEETVLHVMPHWERWGLLRHDGGLRPREIADTILFMVSVPKGTHLPLVEIQPEAPVRDDRSHR